MFPYKIHVSIQIGHLLGSQAMSQKVCVISTWLTNGCDMLKNYFLATITSIINISFIQGEFLQTFKTAIISFS